MFPALVEVLNVWCATMEIVKKAFEMLLSGDFMHSVIEVKAQKWLFLKQMYLLE